MDIPIHHTSQSTRRPTRPQYIFPSAAYPTLVQDGPSLRRGRRRRRTTSVSEPRHERSALVKSNDVPEPDAPVVPPKPSQMAHGLRRPGRSRSYSQPPPFVQAAAPSTRGKPTMHVVRFYDQHLPYYEFTNFAPFGIHWDGCMYPTAEHLFQAHKFMPHRPDLARRICRLNSSRAALEEAGHLRSLQRTDWFDINLRVMDDVLAAKFAQHLSLRDMLLRTDKSELIEDSPVDSFWGCGQDGRGRNELGHALMRLRGKLQEEVARGGGHFAWTTPPQSPAIHWTGQMPATYSPFRTQDARMV